MENENFFLWIQRDTIIRHVKTYVSQQCIVGIHTDIGNDFPDGRACPVCKNKIKLIKEVN